MIPANDPAPADRIMLGPVKVVEVMIPPAPTEQRVTESLGNETVPFDKIRHLCSDKPLRRADRNDPGARR
jgi:hypothetical protein